MPCTSMSLFQFSRPSPHQTGLRAKALLSPTLEYLKRLLRRTALTRHRHAAAIMHNLLPCGHVLPRLCTPRFVPWRVAADTHVEHDSAERGNKGPGSGLIWLTWNYIKVHLLRPLCTGCLASCNTQRGTQSAIPNLRIDGHRVSIAIP